MINMLIGNAILRLANRPHLLSADIVKAASLGAITAVPSVIIVGTLLYLVICKVIGGLLKFDICTPPIFQRLMPFSVINSACASVGTTILLVAQNNGHKIASNVIQPKDIIYATEAGLIGGATIALGCLALILLVASLFEFPPTRSLIGLIFEPWNFKVTRKPFSRTGSTTTTTAFPVDSEAVNTPPPAYVAGSGSSAPHDLGEDPHIAK